MRSEADLEDDRQDARAEDQLLREQPTCILTGEPGEDPDDCTTHGHEVPTRHWNDDPEPGLTIVIRCRECNEKILLNPDGSETRSCDHEWPEEAT
jgi:DNA-directed RNA polymerase subunit RPC12/RpoP